jgi:hypothetical protein
MIETQGLKLYGMREAAEYKGIDYDQFRFYCRDGRGPQCQKVSGRWLFPQEALDAWNKEEAMKKRGRKPHGKQA